MNQAMTDIHKMTVSHIAKRGSKESQAKNAGWVKKDPPSSGWHQQRLRVARCLPQNAVF